MKQRGETTVIVLVACAVVGLALWIFKPKILHGDSRRAKESSQTTEELVKTQEKQAATAAASVVKIGEANASAPESREKSFIAQEVPVALAHLPKPDPEALLAAERRKNAVLEGRIEEADRLYGKALEKAERLERERAAALAAKRASDLELERVAAERLGAERAKNMMIAIAVVAVLLYFYVRFTFVSPANLASAVRDIRHGTGEPNSAIAALDSVTTPMQQLMVRLHAKAYKKLEKVLEPDPNP